MWLNSMSTIGVLLDRLCPRGPAAFRGPSAAEPVIFVLGAAPLRQRLRPARRVPTTDEGLEAVVPGLTLPGVVVIMRGRE